MTYSSFKSEITVKNTDTYHFVRELGFERIMGRKHNQHHVINFSTYQTADNQASAVRAKPSTIRSAVHIKLHISQERQTK